MKIEPGLAQKTINHAAKGGAIGAVVGLLTGDITRCLGMWATIGAAIPFVSEGITRLFGSETNKKAP